MRDIKNFAPIKTRDVAEIMRLLYVKHTLSPLAYKRLHYYVVSLEHMLEAALNTVRAGEAPAEHADYSVQHN